MKKICLIIILLAGLLYPAFAQFECNDCVPWETTAANGFNLSWSGDSGDYVYISVTGDQGYRIINDNEYNFKTTNPVTVVITIKDLYGDNPFYILNGTVIIYDMPASGTLANGTPYTMSARKEEQTFIMCFPSTWGAGENCIEFVTSTSWVTEFTMTVPESRSFSVDRSDAMGNLFDFTVSNYNKDKTAPAIAAVGNGGWQNAASFTVSATATDDLSGVNPGTWQHRTGSSWAAGSSVTIRNEGATRIYFSVADYAGNARTVSCYVYLDRSLPTITAGGSNGWTNSNFTASASVEDSYSGIQSIAYKIGSSGAWKNGSSVQISNEGTTYVFFQVTDNVGLQEDAYSTVQIDKTAPVITASSSSTWSNAPSVPASASATDYGAQVNANTWQYRIGSSGTWTNGNSVNVSLEGETTVYFRVNDGAGNTSTNTCVTRIDRTAPVLTTTVPGWTNAGSVTALAGATDTNGAGVNPATWEYRIGDMGTWKSGNSAAITAEGTTNVYFHAADNAGNWKETSCRVLIDRTAPQISAPDSGWKNTASVTTAASAADSLSGINPESYAYRIGETGVWTKGNIASIANEGTTTVYFRVADMVGNLAQTSCLVQIDRTKPVVAASAPGWVSASSVTAAASASDSLSGIDPGSCEYRIRDTGVWIKGNSVSVMEEGTTTVWFRVADRAGNQEQASCLVRIDRSKPVITTTVPGWSNAAVVTASAAASDSLTSVDPATFQYRIGDTGAWINGNCVDITDEGITIVYFRVADIVGNPAQTHCLVQIDRTEPLLIPTVPGWTNTALVTAAVSAADNSAGIDPATCQYSIGNSGTWTNGSSAGIANEGVTSVHFRIADNAGNVQTASCQVLIDRTKPEITAVPAFTATAGGNAINKDEYIGQDFIYLAPAILDLSGVKYYSFAVTTSITPDPVFTGTWDKTDRRILIGSLQNCLNYIYLQAVDQAGNKSSVSGLVTGADTQAPGAPVVISSTHPRALSPLDAAAEKNVLFNITPGSMGIAGITGYLYSLFKGNVLYAKEGISYNNCFINDDRIHFMNLDDNEADEYYTLSIAAMGANGLGGESTAYRFRVDSAPPRFLRVDSKSHPNPAFYYPSGILSFSWNQPLDFTGVKEYRFKHGLNPVLPDPLPADFAVDNTWLSTNDQFFTCELNDVFAGEYYMAVCAIDFAGNKQYSQRKVCFDLEKPGLSFLENQDKNLETVTGNNEAVINWGNAYDNIGVARLKLELAELNAGSLAYLKEIKLNSGSTSYTFTGLESGITYAAFVTVYDQAGNEMHYRLFFSLAQPEIVIDIPMNFTSYTRGYTVTGAYTSSNVTASLVIPPELNMRWNVPGSGDICPVFLPLQNIAWDYASCTFISAVNADLEFKITVAGFELAGKGLKISSAHGLEIMELTYSVIQPGGEYTTVTYKNVGLAPPPDIYFMSETADNAVNPISLVVNGWALSNITRTAFSGKYWILRDIYIDLSQLVPGLTGNITASEVKIDGTGRVVQAEIASRFILETGLNRFDVLVSSIKGDKLIINNADILFTPGFNLGAAAAVENFSLNQQCTLSMEPGFKVSSFRFAYKDLECTAGNIYIDNNRFYIGKGAILYTGSNPLNFKDMVFSFQGIVDSFIASIPGFKAFMHNFSLESLSGKITPQGLAFDNIVITLPAALESGHITLHDLLLAVTDFQVLNPGVCTETFPVALDYGNVLFNRLVLDNRGVFARVNLPAPAFTGISSLDFDNLPLFADGSTGNCFAGDITMQINGFTITGSNPSFNGKAVAFDSLQTTLPACYSAPRIDFTGFSFNADSLLSGAEIIIPVNFTYAGFLFALPGFVLADNGLTTDGMLLLPPALGNTAITFKDMLLDAVGGFTAPDVASVYPLAAAGWNINARNINFEDHRLILKNVEIPLLPFMGNGNLGLSNLKLNSDGTISGCLPVANNITFKALNGFTVLADMVNLTGNGLALNGRIYLPEALGPDLSLDAAGFDFMLDTDGVIASIAFPGYLTYSLAGWDITGNNFQVSKAGLNIGNSTLTIPGTGKSIEINDIRVNGAGICIGSGNLAQHVDMTLAGWQIRILKAGYAVNRLDAAAEVSLPAGLGAAKIVFNDLTINPDGSVITNAIVPDYDFSLEDINLSFKNTAFDESGLFIEQLKIQLPAALDNKELNIHNVNIGPDGSFQVTGANFDPLNLWGYTWYMEKLEINNQVVSLSGILQLPASLPFGLGGSRVNVTDFRFDTNGTIRNISLETGTPLVFNLFNTWRITADKLSVENEIITIEAAQLAIPSFLGQGNITIHNITINSLTGGVNAGAVTLDNIALNWQGLNFQVDKVSITDNRGLDFAGLVSLPAGFKQGFAGKILNISCFQIRPDKLIGDVTGSLDGVMTPFWDYLGLKNYHFGLTKENDELYLDAGGIIVPGPVFTGTGLNNKEIAIESLRIRTRDSRIIRFTGKSCSINFMLLNEVNVENGCIGINLDNGGNDIEFSVSGNLVLNNNFPGSLKGSRVAIKQCVVGRAGNLKAFDAILTLNPGIALNNSILVQNGVIRAAVQANRVLFDISGQILLGSTFPAGIAGALLNINSLQFNGYGQVVQCDITASYPDKPLLGNLNITNGMLRILAGADSNFMVSLGGNIVLPAVFPQGMAGKQVQINEFLVNSLGSIEKLDAGISGFNTLLFNSVALSNGAIAVMKNGNDEFIFTVSGNLVLPGNLPDGLGNKHLTIRSFKLSSRAGIIEFTAAGSPLIDFTFFGGVMGAVNTISLNQSGFSCSGLLKFSDNFPAGIKGLQIRLNNFAMTWAGQLTAIDASINSLTVNLLGFSISVSNLRFQTDRICLDSCVLSLPAGLNLPSVILKDAYFDTNGKFHGAIGVSRLEAALCGFGLFLNAPRIDLDAKAILFDNVIVKAPDFMKIKTVELGGVRLTANGLEFNKSVVKLDSFAIPDNTGIGFNNVFVEFIKTGSTFIVTGGGTVFVPDVGNLTAELSFAEKSTTYPWGIRYAQFSFNCSGAGLSLGTTGLYLNGVSGGFGFGFPDEVPVEFRKYFESNGTRLNLGLTVVDASCGGVVKGNVHVWVDIVNWGWVFNGKVEIFRKLSSEITAALSKRGFSGEFYADLSFVRGRINIHIFPYNGDTKLSAGGQLEFGMHRGTIIDWHWDFNVGWCPWCWNCSGSVHVPDSDVWFGSAGAALGLFSNGRQGYKGYINVPVWNEIGIFVPSDGGSASWGNVSDYQLYDPNAGRTSRSTDQRSAPGKKQTRHIYIMDQPRDASQADTYLFRVPGNPAGNSGLKPLSRGITAITVNPTERIVFAVSYTEGEPVIRAIAPSGREFRPSTQGVETMYPEWGVIFAIVNPEAGEWKVDVSNVVSEEAYRIKVFGVARPPALTLTTPAFEKEPANGSFQARGTAAQYSGAAAPVTVYISDEKNSFTGEPAAVVNPAANGAFTADIDTSKLVDGEYYLYAGIQDTPDNPERLVYAPGSFIVNNINKPLPVVTNLAVSDDRNGALVVSFSDPENKRIKGFNLYITDLDNAQTKKIYLGYLTSIEIPGYENGRHLRVGVTALDQNGKEGNQSAPVEIAINSPQPVYNSFTVAAGGTMIRTTINNAYNGVLSIIPDNPRVTSTASDYAGVDIVECPANLFIHFPGRRYNIASGTITAAYIIRPVEGIVPGEYAIRIRVKNLGNNENAQEVVLHLDITYPPVIVDSVTPTGWESVKGTEIEIRGDNFYTGTALYLDDTLIPVTSLTLTGIKGVIPAGITGSSHQIRVKGAGGDTVANPVSVLEPDYIVIGGKTQTEVKAGRKTQLIFGIQSRYGFNENVSYMINGTPAGWTVTVDKPILPACCGYAVMDVQVPADSELGDKLIEVVFDRGYVLPLHVTVTPGDPNPHISGLTSVAGFPGDTTEIIGYGFGESGQVFLGSQALDIISYAAEKITVRITNSAVSGDMVVDKQGIKSNGCLYSVKTRGFHFYNEPGISLQPGEEKRVNLGVRGYGDTVSLKAESNSSLLTIKLDKTALVPGGNLEVTVSSSALIVPGTYTITVTGQNTNNTATAVLPVVITGKFQFITESLPDGREGCSYETRVETENGSSTIHCSLEPGLLPAGLELDGNGKISGVPGATGSFEFIVSATDGAMRKINKSYTITIDANSWGFPGGDSGRSNYNPVASPADNSTLWRSESCAHAQAIITGGNLVFAVSPDSITALEAESGKKAYVIKGRFENYAYANGLLYLLDKKGCFSAVKGATGEISWKKQGIHEFIVTGRALLLSGFFRIMQVNQQTGVVEKTLKGWLSLGGNPVSQDDKVYRIEKDKLLQFTIEKGWKTILKSGPYNFRDLVCDAISIVLLRSDGKLIVLNKQHNIVLERNLNRNFDKLLLADDRIILVHKHQLLVINRYSGEDIFKKNLTVDEIIAGKDKIFTGSYCRLTSLDGYTGKILWTHRLEVSDMALTYGKLFALNSRDLITCFNGSDKKEGSGITADLDPPLPEGNDGCYMKQPFLTITPWDLRFPFKTIHYSLDGVHYRKYEKPVMLPPGDYDITISAVKENGYITEFQLAGIKVDKP